jgi:acyl-coenzyme A synthetase/AMP-(fatty) acid ligase
MFRVLPILVDHWTFLFSYGPLLNGATTVIFEGVPSLQFSRFGEIIETQGQSVYTATTVALWQRESIEYVQNIN